MNALELREKRKEKGLTQKQLAELLCISSNTIINWERGEDEIPELKKTLLENFFSGNTQNSVIVKEDEFTTLIIQKLFDSETFKTKLLDYIKENASNIGQEEAIKYESYLMDFIKEQERNKK